jgi:glycosyltransferase involved in cell wall biosynthesis
LDLVRNAKMPIVTTLHTVLEEPSRSQMATMDELLSLSERVVVMSRKGASFLPSVHGICPEKIDLIPHGIPNVMESAGRAFRSRLGIDGPMILTFGLLTPDKGIEHVIQAMPEILREHPGATYYVVGATHPKVRSEDGETYRASLMKLASDLGIANSVRFENRFVSIEELVDYLGATDFYVTPYLNPKQTTSGTLAYAVGAGKAVISTPYWYAQELLAEGRGLLVPYRDDKAISESVLSVVRNKVARQEMGRRSAEFGKQMRWPEVARRYWASFAKAGRQSTVNRTESVAGALSNSGSRAQSSSAIAL